MEDMEHKSLIRYISYTQVIWTPSSRVEEGKGGKGGGGGGGGCILYSAVNFSRHSS